jgi:integration host factor subunit alpha
MTLTKAHIVEAFQNELGFSKRQSIDLVEKLLETIKSSLANGEEVLFSGFGKFCTQDKKVRRGRNPATGESLMLKPRRVVTFKCSKKLRERINNGAES